jgi:peroxiredoxin
MPKLLLVRLVALVLWTAIFLMAGCGQKKAELPYVDPKDLAPNFTIGYEKGQVVTLRDLRGKVVVLSFTLDYVDVCGSLRECCKTLYAADAGHEVAFVEIDRDTSARAESVLVNTDSLFTVIHDRESISRAYRIQKIPTTVIIDKLGKAAFRHEGYNAETTCASILRPQILKCQGN